MSAAKKPKPHPLLVAALVHARGNGGAVSLHGPFGRHAYSAVTQGFAEWVGDCAELNLRGQDVADEAMARVGRKAR